MQAILDITFEAAHVERLISSHPESPAYSPQPFLGESRQFLRGMAHLQKQDPKLSRLIQKHGKLDFQPGGDLFEALVESIISQQLAGSAAAAIIKRLRALYSRGILSAATLASTPVSRLRKAGVSPQKIRYLKELSFRVLKKQLVLEELKDKSDEEILRVLDPVLGIGPWTVQMLLISPWEGPTCCRWTILESGNPSRQYML